MSNLIVPHFSMREQGSWKPKYKLEKREGDWGDLLVAGQDHLVSETPYEVIEGEGNVLTHGGVSILWEALIGTSLTGQLVPYSNSNARIGVGDSTTAAAATDTALVAATNKLYKAMDATYPLHTDGQTSTGTPQQIQFRSSFTTGEANWVWNEWVVTNVAAPGSGTGRTLNRKVESLGTKASGTWTITVTITIS